MKWYKELSRTAQLLIISLVGLMVVFWFIGLFLNIPFNFEPMGKYTLGLVTGTILSIVKTVSMEKSINHIVDMEESDAKIRGQLYYVLRYFITIVYVAVVIIFRKYIGVFGAIFGMLLLIPASFVANFILKKEEKRESQK